MDSSWYLGHDIHGWGLKGNRGEFHNGGVVLKHAAPILDSSVYINGTPVGILLDMDNCTLDYFIEGKNVLSYSNFNWKGKKLYPSISLITAKEEMEINFNVKFTK